jgi:GntR family transcriptional repressor for pyruvate dehydrogenase complex
MARLWRDDSPPNGRTKTGGWNIVGQVAARNNVERLEALLMERGLGPGNRLPTERELAAELGLSRSSVRESLRRLIDLGIVEARQGSGTYLMPLDLDDLQAVRLRLEPFAARLAARHRDDAHVAALCETLASLRDTLDDAREFAVADARLHAIVVDASASRALRVLLAALDDLLRHSRAASSPDSDVRVATLAQHEVLVEAIQAGDARRAERAMREHLNRVGKALTGVDSA